KSMLKAYPDKPAPKHGRLAALQNPVVQRNQLNRHPAAVAVGQQPAGRLESEAFLVPPADEAKAQVLATNDRLRHRNAAKQRHEAGRRQLLPACGAILVPMGKPELKQLPVLRMKAAFRLCDFIVDSTELNFAHFRSCRFPQESKA